MKTVKSLTTLILAGLFGISINSCKKYEEGPALSLKSKKKRLAREWVIDAYHRNGINETSQLIISNYVESYTENGVHSRSYNDKNGDKISETGEWKFDNNKEQISVTGIGSIEWTDQTSTVSSSYYNILRLTSKELWYYYENGGSKHEIHLKAK